MKNYLLNKVTSDGQAFYRNIVPGMANNGLCNLYHEGQASALASSVRLVILILIMLHVACCIYADCYLI